MAKESNDDLAHTTRKLIAIDDDKSTLEQLQSDLSDCFHGMKMLKNLSFSQETVDHAVRGEEHYLYCHYKPEHKEMINWFILGFCCGREK